jgi:hypothetical protein
MKLLDGMIKSSKIWAIKQTERVVVLIGGKVKYLKNLQKFFF